MSDHLEGYDRQEKPRPEEKDKEMDIEVRWPGSRSWIWGVVLLVLGALLLLQNFTGLRFVYLNNWWAVFILVPGISNLVQAWERYRESGNFTPGARSSAFWGIVLIAVALTFLFDLGWGLMMPLLFIAGGAFLLFTARSWQR
jgi:hypothetical protein